MKSIENSVFKRFVWAILFSSLLFYEPTANVFSKAFSQAQQPATSKVSIHPATTEAEVGQQLQLKTYATDERGRQIEVKAGYWIVLPGELATVDGNGNVSLLAAGELQVVAIVQGKKARATIRVNAARVAKLEIPRLVEPQIVGERFQLTAKALDSRGGQAKDVRLSWQSSNSAVATVDQTGQITALAVGNATITVSADGVRNSVSVEVVNSDVHRVTLEPAVATARTGEVVQFAADTKTIEGTTAKFAKVRWAVNGDGALIGQDGKFVAERPGSFEIVASAGEQRAKSIVRVSVRNVERQLETVGRIPLGAIQASELWPFGKYLYVATLNDELRVYDLSNPANPQLTETLKIDARSILDVSLTADGRIGVLTREGASNRQNGLLFLDTSDLAHPKILSAFTETVSGAVHSAFIAGHYVYLTDDATGSMRVVDFRDAKHPKQVARWELALPLPNVQTGHDAGMSLGMRHLHDIQVKDGLAYLAYWRDGLVILDVGAGIRGGSPEQPKLVSQFRFNHTDLYGKGWLAGTREVFRYQNWVFVGDEVIPAEFDPSKGPRRLGRGMLHVIDVADIANPRRVAEYVLPEGGAYNIWVENDILAMGYYGGAGRLLDVSGELTGNLALQGREIARLQTGSLTIDQEGERREPPFTFGARFFGDLILFNDMHTGIWITKLKRK
ncbi:MAG: Ig-like domain-containing protein [Acidobacteria bacterium]|nr:Ig-like domain-containing protein [Acidobacteriota bacterium]